MNNIYIVGEIAPCVNQIRKKGADFVSANSPQKVKTAIFNLWLVIFLFKLLVYDSEQMANNVPNRNPNEIEIFLTMELQGKVIFVIVISVNSVQKNQIF